MENRRYAPDYVCRAIECEHYRGSSGSYCALDACKYSEGEICDLLHIDAAETVSRFDESQIEELARFKEFAQEVAKNNP